MIIEKQEFSTSQEHIGFVRKLTLGMALCLSFAALLTGASRAYAVEEANNVTTLFNATLSLAGNCNSIAADPVPDPGCPGAPLPPEGRIIWPTGVATDPSGDIYVTNFNKSSGLNTFHVDVYSATGHFLTSVTVKGVTEEVGRRTTLAVDSTGHLYVGVEENRGDLLRFDPTVYEPGASKIAYNPSPVLVRTMQYGSIVEGMAINPNNDHLFLTNTSGGYGTGKPLNMGEYGPAVTGIPNTPISESLLPKPPGVMGQMAIDFSRNRIYLAGGTDASAPPSIYIYDLQAPHELLGEITGAAVPNGKFESGFNRLELAVNEETGDLYIGDIFDAHKIYELNEEGIYLETIKEPVFESDSVWIAVDNGKLSPNRGFLYVPWGGSFSQGHLFAFEPKGGSLPPVVRALSVTGINVHEAVLHAQINPKGIAAHYRLEYVTRQHFEEEGFNGAQVAGEGDLAASNEAKEVSASVTGLEAGTAYVFRAVAENECKPEGCTGEKQAGFTTYAPYVQSGSCPNEALRTGSSAALPDCRAYELVTPADTAGLAPFAPEGATAGDKFGIATTSPDGERVVYAVTGGLIPGLEGTGAINGDAFIAKRTANGWESETLSPPSTAAARSYPGGLSPDLSTYVISIDRGTFALDEEETNYIRKEDGTFHLAGQDLPGSVHNNAVLYLASGDAHEIISAEGSLYDRTADGVVHFLSLLPGEVPTGNPLFEGTSEDGSAVAFGDRSGRLYLRQDDAVTHEATFDIRSGEPVTCSVSGSLAGAEPSYEWMLDGVPVGGANSSTFTPEPAQAGSVLQCVVTAQNGEGGLRSAGPALVIDEAHHGAPPRPTGGITVLGQPEAGATLECDPGAWSGAPSLTYQWYRNGDPIAGQTSSAYEVEASDSGALLQCAVTGVAAGTSIVSFSHAQEVEAANPPQQVNAPVVVNVTHPKTAPVVGDQLECQPGTWLGAPSFTYQWLRNGEPIASATSATYTIAAGDEAKAVQCEVLAENPDGRRLAATKAEAVAPLAAVELPSGSLAVKGTFAEGQELECAPEAWQGSPSFSYQWLRNGEPIGGATSASYTLTASDHETVVQCLLTAAGEKATVVALAGGFVNAKPSFSVKSSSLTAAFAGLSAEGRYMFYLLGGDLYRYDSADESTIRITQSGDALPAIVSSLGTGAYFVSPSKGAEINPSAEEANPLGEEPEEGKNNLYYWNGSEIRFVGAVADRDVEGEFRHEGGSGQFFGGFKEWLHEIAQREYGLDPARTTPDGTTLLFESHKGLGGFNGGGAGEVYRYDAAEGALDCLSCNPSEAPPSGDSRLRVNAFGGIGVVTSSPLNLRVLVANLSSDGRRAFFESPDRLVPGDNDGVTDIYEWEADGKGSCADVRGCLFLISSGQGARPTFIYGASQSGNDVYFVSSDLLVADDHDETPSVYDARVEGGFPPRGERPGECLGEACQPTVSPPVDVTPATFPTAGNVKPRQHKCPKGKRSDGKGKCRAVHKRHRKKHHHHRTTKSNGRAGR